MKYYTDQSTIPQFIPRKDGINTEKRAEQEIKNIFAVAHSEKRDPKPTLGRGTQNITFGFWNNSWIKSNYLLQEKRRLKHAFSLIHHTRISDAKLNKYHIPNYFAPGRQLNVPLIVTGLMGNIVTLAIFKLLTFPLIVRLKIQGQSPFTMPPSC